MKRASFRGANPLAAGRELSAMSVFFVAYYIVSILVLVLHFAGVLARHRLEWLIYVLAVTVFPAVIYL